MAGERTLPGMGLKGFWTPGTDEWGGDPGMDGNMLRLSVLAQLSVISRTDELPEPPSLGDIYIVPAGDTVNPNWIAVWDGPSGSETWNYIEPKDGWLAWVQDEGVYVSYDADGTAEGWNVLETGGGGGGGPAPYDIRGGFKVTPGSDEVIDSIMIVRDIEFPAGLAGSEGNVGTNADASFEISVQDDSVEIGTITIATDGTFTFATTGGTAKTVAAGSRLDFVAPTTPDATVANASWTLLGTVAS